MCWSKVSLVTAALVKYDSYTPVHPYNTFCFLSFPSPLASSISYIFWRATEAILLLKGLQKEMCQSRWNENIQFSGNICEWPVVLVVYKVLTLDT